MYDANGNEHILGHFPPPEDPMSEAVFIVGSDRSPPKRVYIVLHDERCDVSYKSNKVRIP